MFKKIDKNNEIPDQDSVYIGNKSTKDLWIIDQNNDQDVNAAMTIAKVR